MAVVKQVGGDHYEAPTQHWDLMEEFDVSYLEANATKYLLRYDRKGTPTQDLEKAKSYLERALVTNRGARRLVPGARLDEFYVVNEMDRKKMRLFDWIHRTGTRDDFRNAVAYINLMLRDLMETGQ